MHFRDISPAEETEFRQWARDNYTKGAPINPLWHPVVRDECDRMNFNRFRVAIDIQDAGNMRAIAREFVKVVDDAMHELQVTTQVWTDPAVVLLVSKLAELSGAHRPEAFSDAYRSATSRAG